MKAGIDLYCKAKGLGCSVAYKRLGELYMKTDADVATAMYIERQVACGSNDGYLQHHLAVACDNGMMSDVHRAFLEDRGESDMETGMMFYTHAHVLGHIPATLSQAVHWEQLYPEKYLYISPRKDVDTAIQLYTEAMKQGSLVACFSLCAKISIINASNIVGFRTHLSECLLATGSSKVYPSDDEFYYLEMASGIVDNYIGTDPCFPCTSGLEHELMAITSAVARGQFLMEYKLVEYFIRSVLETTRCNDYPSRKQVRELRILLRVIEKTLSLTPPLERGKRQHELQSARKSKKRRERKKRGRAYKRKMALQKGEAEDRQGDPLLAAMLEDIDLIDPLTGEFYVYSSDSD